MRPLYTQVAGYIEAQVEEREDHAGPAAALEKRDMGEYYGVAYQTVRQCDA